MHERARLMGLKTPESCHPTSRRVLDRFTSEVGFPIIIKPFDGAGSKGTVKINNPSELEAVWNNIQHICDQFRVEQFINGTQFFVDMLIQDGRVVFEMLSQYTYHVMNFRSEIPGGVCIPHNRTTGHHKILDAARQIVIGFGLRCGITHTEFFMTDNGGVVLGETACRLGGGPIPAMAWHAYGIDLIREWLHIELYPLYVPQEYQGKFLGAEYFSADTYGAFGEIIKISSRDELLCLPDVIDAMIWKAVGDTISPPNICSDVLGYYICSGSSFDDITAKFASIRTEFVVKVKKG